MYDDVEIPILELASRDAALNLPPPLSTLALRDQGSNISREQMQWAYRSYYGTITHVDHAIGLLLDALEASGADSNTIIVFSSDHGDQLFEHGITGKNCFFEPSVRAPFMFSLPGRVKPARYDQLIETIDLLPTLFELIGLREPREVQGRSFAPLVADMGRAYEPHDAVFNENIIPQVITGGNLDMPFEKGKGSPARAIQTPKWSAPRAGNSATTPMATQSFTTSPPTRTSARISRVEPRCATWSSICGRAYSIG